MHSCGDCIASVTGVWKWFVGTWHTPLLYLTLSDTDNSHSYKYCPCLQVLCSINSIVHNPRAPVIIYKQSKGRAPNGNKDIGQDCGFEHLVPIIEMWVDELTSLKVSSWIFSICLENLLGLVFVVLYKAKKPHFSKIGILLLSYFALFCFWDRV